MSTYGLTNLIDNYSRYIRPSGGGGVAWLRVKKFIDSTQPPPIQAQMGFTFTPTASGAMSGYTDYQIDPPPVVRLISMHNLGQAAQAGIQLREGARDILISNSFVLANMQARGFTDPRQVFNDPSTVGLVVNEGKLIVSFDSVMPDYAYGGPATWSCFGNANEIR